MLIKEKAVVSFVRNCHPENNFYCGHADDDKSQSRIHIFFFFFFALSALCQTLAASSLKVITQLYFLPRNECLRQS